MADGETADVAVDAVFDGGEGGSIQRPDGGADSMADAASDALIDNSDGFDGFVCDPNWGPKDNACVVNDQAGVFVSPAGMDGAAGTKLMPLKKFQEGIAKAKTAGKRLYVCTGTYSENAVIDASKDGVQIFGGLDCTAWTYSASNSVKVAPASGYALKLDTLTTGARIEDVEFDGPDAVNAGDSSIAVFANAASAVVMRRVIIKAGNAANGTAGGTTTNYTGASAPTGNVPVNGMLDKGAVAKICTCTDATASTGGKGGNAGDGVNTLATAGAAGAPNLGGVAPNDGAGGTPGAACTQGHTGTTAAAGVGGAGSTALGTLTLGGWTVATAGTSGTIGAVAQGGGGGGGGIFPVGVPSGGGGGGGCGGCGGGMGSFGTSAGSSFALVSVSSAITLDTCTLTARNGGVGGKGGDGQVAQSGGDGGNQSSPGCRGGAGGGGGLGGAGGGGAGGHSIAIAYSGAAPTDVGTVMKTVGNGGAGGAAGAGAAQPQNLGAGATGLSSATRAF